MGSYVNNHLIKDETVVYETTYHWSIFFTLASIFTLTLWAWLKRSSDEFVITNKRVVIKTGLIARSTIELNLNKVESISVEQSVMGRIFGFGTVTVLGTGETREPFTRIGNPLEFRRKFQEQYDQYTQSRGTMG